MSKIQAISYLFIMLFIVVFLTDYLFIKRKYVRKLKKKKKKKEPMELSYLVTKFNLDKDKLPLNKVLLLISFSNALIISLVSSVILLINTYTIVQLLIGFILLIALIYAIYEIMGRNLERRGYTKNGK